MSERPLVFVAANRKGGCAKSTSILSLAGVASTREKLTLVIDIDPQGSLTQCLAGVQAYEGLHPRETLAAIFDDSLGGDPQSIEFCQNAGLDYVSCSPFRVPIARLAAAQAALKQDKTGKTPGFSP